MGTAVLGLSGPAVLAAVAVLVVVIVVLIVSSRASGRKRLEGFTGELGGLGWTAGHEREPGGNETAKVLAARAAPLREVMKRPKGVRWWATRELGGREYTVLEHAYTVSTGESSHTVVHLIAMTGCPGRWPGLTVAEAGVFAWLGKVLGFRGLEVDDAEFNRRFSVKGESAEFALLMLSPEVRAVLGRERGGPRLGVGGGTVMLWRRGGAKTAAEAVALAERLEEVVAGIPPELEAWGA